MASEKSAILPTIVVFAPDSEVGTVEFMPAPAPPPPFLLKRPARDGSDPFGLGDSFRVNLARMTFDRGGAARSGGSSNSDWRQLFSASRPPKASTDAVRQPQNKSLGDRNKGHFKAVRERPAGVSFGAPAPTTISVGSTSQPLSPRAQSPAP